MCQKKMKARKKICDRREEEEEIHGMNMAFRAVEHSACRTSSLLSLCQESCPGLALPFLA